MEFGFGGGVGASRGSRGILWGFRSVPSGLREFQGSSCGVPWDFKRIKWHSSVAPEVSERIMGVPGNLTVSRAFI